MPDESEDTADCQTYFWLAHVHILSEWSIRNWNIRVVPFQTVIRFFLVWPSTGVMSIARGCHTATVLRSGKVLVNGGGNRDGYLSSAELYDSSTGNWSSTGVMFIASGCHTATVLRSGKVLVNGGGNRDGYLSSAELYDPWYMGYWWKVVPLWYSWCCVGVIILVILLLYIAYNRIFVLWCVVALILVFIQALVNKEKFLSRRKKECVSLWMSEVVCCFHPHSHTHTLTHPHTVWWITMEPLGMNAHNQLRHVQFNRSLVQIVAFYASC